MESDYQKIADNVTERFGDTCLDVQAMLLAEEVGETLSALRRFLGRARVTQGISEVREELADVIITANVLGILLDVDLAGAVKWKLGQIDERGGL